MDLLRGAEGAVPEGYVVRAVRADEWRAVRELRLAALLDPVAHLAFLETYEDALARSDAFWKERTEKAAVGVRERQQFVVESEDGAWVGTVTVLVEEAGTRDFFGGIVERRQGHLVGVFLRDGHRGKGLGEAMFAVAVEWARGVGVERVRLFVNEGNGRAAAFYRRVGFVGSGVTVEGDEGRELEYVLEPA
ncbi:GNAT family N-acetyltransferase [Streptomyces sp. NBC_00481]|uniref:GNAT family N-acetyltransferase n=1 Tax=unclassified Streptomyces TaxID=2593676 RepID=UPI002DDAE359|nr:MULTISPECIES: GNAT family N-acetyltransferase [unclassified Streptomyces]WRY97400.1 GNAT family N-acetyltransferase [Streptomyces sp. NBC_00481]